MFSSIDHHFTSFDPRRDTCKLGRFLESQDLGYPHYASWADKALMQLISGEKFAYLDYSNGELIADLIFQDHRSLQRVIEIKNGRVHPSVSYSGVLRFMLKVLEKEATKSGYHAMMCDVREERRDILTALSRCGFIPTLTLPLYDPSKRDVTMVKFLSRERENGLIDQINNTIFSLAV